MTVNKSIFISLTLFFSYNVAYNFEAEKGVYSTFCADYARTGSDDNFAAFIRSAFGISAFDYTDKQLSDICSAIESDAYADIQWSIACKRYEKFSNSDLLVSYIMKQFRLSSLHYDTDYLVRICREAQHKNASLWSIACGSYRTTKNARLVVSQVMESFAVNSFNHDESDLELVCDSVKSEQYFTTEWSIACSFYARNKRSDLLEAYKSYTKSPNELNNICDSVKRLKRNENKNLKLKNQSSNSVLISNAFITITIIISSTYFSVY